MNLFAKIKEWHSTGFTDSRWNKIKKIWASSIDWRIEQIIWEFETFVFNSAKKESINVESQEVEVKLENNDVIINTELEIKAEAGIEYSWRIENEGVLNFECQNETHALDKTSINKINYINDRCETNASQSFREILNIDTNKGNHLDDNAFSVTTNPENSDLNYYQWHKNSVHGASDDANDTSDGAIRFKNKSASVKSSELVRKNKRMTFDRFHRFKMK